MKRLPILMGFGLLTMFGLASLGTPQQPAANRLEQGIPNDAIEVQLRGPLHEAFAQPWETNQEPGAATTKEPPQPIAEEPPEQRPESPDAQWIPGYWAWDAERDDFIWVSGVYRIPPQGRTFVPGYWEQAGNGWRWVSGFWSNDNQADISYTPQPPAPLENGPSMPAPDDNSMYVPGTWIYRDGRFVWRPGYYAAYQEGRVWVPARYNWTPSGYVFVDSYWDVPFENRGLIYAPVCFNQPLWTNPYWSYRPGFVLNFGLFFDSVFLRHGSGHYHYGNYYDGRYARYGYRPWYSGAGRHDPMFAYHGWQNRQQHPNWIANQSQVYANRTSGRAVAPPVTLAQQTNFVNTKQGSPVVTPIRQFQNTNVRVVNATPAQQKIQLANVQQNREIVKNRQKVESSAVTKNNSRTSSPITDVKVNRANILGTSAKAVAPASKLPPDLRSPLPTVPQKAVSPTTKSPPPLTKQSSPAPKATPLPKKDGSAQKQAPPAVQQAAPTPKSTPTPTKANAPVPKQVAPPPAKKAAPPTMTAPPPAKKAPAPTIRQTPQPKAAPATNQKTAPAAPRTIAPRPTAPPKTNVTRPSPPRVQPAPRPQPAPRVTTPPRGSNPAPARSTPSPNRANNQKKR